MLYSIEEETYVPANLEKIKIFGKRFVADFLADID
jgi:hypothetical protein